MPMTLSELTHPFEKLRKCTKIFVQTKEIYIFLIYMGDS